MTYSPMYWVSLIIGIILAVILLWVLLRLVGAI